MKDYKVIIVDGDGAVIFCDDGSFYVPKTSFQRFIDCIREVNSGKEEVDYSYEKPENDDYWISRIHIVTKNADGSDIVLKTRDGNQAAMAIRISFMESGTNNQHDVLVFQLMNKDIVASSIFHDDDDNIILMDEEGITLVDDFFYLNIGNTERMVTTIETILEGSDQLEDYSGYNFTRYEDVSIYSEPYVVIDIDNTPVGIYEKDFDRLRNLLNYGKCKVFKVTGGNTNEEI